jgi:hypothetical protein
MVGKEEVSFVERLDVGLDFIGILSLGKWAEQQRKQQDRKNAHL